MQFSPLTGIQYAQLVYPHPSGGGGKVWEMQLQGPASSEELVVAEEEENEFFSHISGARCTLKCNDDWEDPHEDVTCE